MQQQQSMVQINQNVNNFKIKTQGSSVVHTELTDSCMTETVHIYLCSSFDNLCQFEMGDKKLLFP